MFQDVEPIRFQRLAAQVTADQDCRPSRQKVLNALGSLLDQAEIHRLNAIRNSTTTARVPGRLSEVEESLLPFVRDPIRTAVQLGIRRLGEIAAEFLTVDEMIDVAKEAAAQCGDPGVREVIVDKLWDGLRDLHGDCWVA